MLGFRLPFYKTPTLLLSLGLSVRVLWYLILSRPDVIHASSPGAHGLNRGFPLPSSVPSCTTTAASVHAMRLTQACSCFQGAHSSRQPAW